MTTRSARRAVRVTAFVLAVTLICFGIAQWISDALSVNSIREIDARYYPLVAPIAAAAVNGLVTIFGVTIALLLLRFHYKNQVNPIRLELYKRQLDVLSQMVRHASAVKDAIGPLEKVEHLRSQFRAARDYLKREELLVPPDLRMAYMHLLILCHEFPYKTVGIEIRADSPLYDHIDDAYLCFLNMSRCFAGTDPLTTGVIELMHQEEADEVILRASMSHERMKSVRSRLRSENGNTNNQTAK